MSFWNKIQNIFNGKVSQNRQKVVVVKDSNVSTRQAHIDKIDNFSEVLSQDDIILDVNIDSQDGLLKYLANLAKKSGIVSDAESLYGKYLLRESQASTNLSDGVAMPHVQDENVLVMKMLIVRLSKPITWGNGKKIKLIISLLTPKTENNFEHVSYLAGITTKLLKNNFVDELLISDSKDILKLFNQS